jgi:hypothetical protein
MRPVLRGGSRAFDYLTAGQNERLYDANCVPAGGDVQFGFQGTLNGTYTTPTTPVLNGSFYTVG